MMEKRRWNRQWHFGSENPVEAAIVAEIVFRREVKKQSLQAIADDLNALGLKPRRAACWTWATIRYFYVRNASPGKGIEKG